MGGDVSSSYGSKKTGNIPGRDRHRKYGTQGRDGLNWNSFHREPATPSEAASREDRMRYPVRHVPRKTRNYSRYASIEVRPINLVSMKNTQRITRFGEEHSVE